MPPAIPKRKVLKSPAPQTNQPTSSSVASAVPSAPKQAKDLVKVALYDASALKNNLDDVAKQVVLDAGYYENLMISNVKIALGLLAMASALYAQFGPGKFPANWWTIAACVASYVVLTFGLSLYSWRAEGDAFLVTKPRRAQDAGLRVTSRIDRFADEYVIIISDNLESKVEARTSTKITKFYHEDGYLSDEPFRQLVEELLARYEQTAAAANGKKRQ